MRPSLIVPVIAGFVAACASEAPAPPPGPTAQAATEQICTREYPTGSNISVTRCRTQAEIEADREAARAGMKEVGRHSRPRR